MVLTGGGGSIVSAAGVRGGRVWPGKWGPGLLGRPIRGQRDWEVGWTPGPAGLRVDILFLFFLYECIDYAIIYIYNAIIYIYLLLV